MKKIIATVAVAGSLTLVGGLYMAANALPEEPSATQEWADARYSDWIKSMNHTYAGMCGEFETISEYRECIPEDPRAYVENVKASGAGELQVTLADGPWVGKYATSTSTGPANVSNAMIQGIAIYSDDVESVTVTTANGKYSDTAEYEPWMISLLQFAPK